MDRKTFGDVRIKSEDKGTVSAVFSQFDVKDLDGDVTRPGAFENSDVIISAYGHGSWEGQPPVGKGHIRSTPKEAILEGQFFMDQVAGRETFLAVKGLGSLQEWSYGYDATQFSFGDWKGDQVRFLEKLKVFEVSPVLRGSGIDTRTLQVKQAAALGALGGLVIEEDEPPPPRPEPILSHDLPAEYKAAIRYQKTATSDSAWDVGAIERRIPADASVADLRSVYAWCDPGGDPEVKDSYRFPHHEGVKGDASLRACTVIIAALNGHASSIPDADRAGVYNHVARHLRDAKRDVPDLAEAPNGNVKMADAVLLSLAGVWDLIARAEDIKDRRPLSAKTAQYLSWLEEDLRRMRRVLSSNDEIIRHELIRFISQSQDLSATGRGA